MSEQVVVTGIGAITPLGDSAEASWQALLRSESGIRRITKFDVSDLAVQIGGEVRDFDPETIMSRPDARRLDPHAWFAAKAGLDAMEDANVDDPFEPARFAVTVGTGSGAVILMQEATRTLDSAGPRRVQPGVVITGGPDGAAAYLSQRLNAQGSSIGVSATCASGASALGEAMRAIRHGYLDACLVVGADACLTRVNFAANGNIRSLTTAHNDEPERACRPFDRDRSGFVMSEGGTAILLESETHARNRRARTYGTLAGYGASSDAYHATAPHPDGTGAARAMTDAFADAGLSPRDIDHVNAHGTGTPLNDSTEVAALRTVFGERATSIPITATKSLAGHLLGGAGTFEAIVSLLGMRDGLIHPTANLDDPEFPEMHVVTGEPLARDMRYVLTNSFGFGGHNVSLVLARPE